MPGLVSILTLDDGCAHTEPDNAARGSVTVDSSPRNPSENNLELIHVSTSAGYYEFDRPEVIALIPASARSILEFGCATGACGARIKKERGARVVGIEYVTEAAAIAADRLDRVLVGDAETMDLSAHFQAGEFDAILFADVLEHLRDPDAMLRRVLPFLSPRGCVIASIPNVRNCTVLTMLAAGDWTYEEAGLLDRTHVHFFTQREIQRMIGRAGLRLDDMRFVLDRNHAAWVASGKPVDVSIGSITVRNRTVMAAEELFVYQFLLRADQAPTDPFASRERPLVSIVIPARGQFAMTRACVESLRRNTPAPFEIILVDNASSDGTAEWAAEQSDLRCVRNDVNRGFAAACNQGLAVARGDYVVLLNNDTEVPPAWIDPLITPMMRYPDVGLTGPRSNRVFSQQVVEEADYGNDMAAMERFALDWGLRHRATGTTIGKLVGFCLAIRRDVIDAIGAMDERFGIGNFEDDDYCVRAMLAGFRCWLAHDTFVHHWGSQTFRSENVDLEGLMVHNWEIFRAKWDLPDSPNGTRVYQLDRILDLGFDSERDFIPLPFDATSG